MAWRDPYNHGISKVDREVATQRGRDARAAGQPIDHNPYPYDNAEWRNWKRAYEAEFASEKDAT